MRVLAGTLLLPVILAQNTSCLTTINSLALLESKIQNTSTQRTYTLCALTEFDIGFLDFSYELYDGQAMIPLRPNLLIKCGDDGSRENRCTIRGGDVQVDGTHLLGISATSLENVRVQGLTFENATRHAVWMTKAGNVSFEDCEFRFMKQSISPVLVDYFDENSRGSSLSANFVGCAFNRITYSGWPAQPAVIVGNGQQNRIAVRDSIFSNNNLRYNNSDASRNSFLIETTGPLTVVGSCFENNQVGVAPIVTYGQQSFLVDNYNDNSNGGLCALASHYDTATNYDNNSPRCASFDAVRCLARGTAMPTSAPTSQPTAPTNFPTFSPTISHRPTPQPTERPSASPSSSPSSSPSRTFRPTTTTRSPTREPTGQPTIVPTTMPVPLTSLSGTSASLGLSTSLWVGLAAFLLCYPVAQ